MNRRSFLKGIGLAAAYSQLPTLLNACSSETTTSPPQRIMQPLRTPAELSSSGSLMAASGRTDLWPDISSNAILINGTFLGPTIRIAKGASLNIQFTNQLSEDSNIHWHGLSAPAAMDGHPADAVKPGASFNYNFPILDRAATYWYHAHPDRATAKQAYLGLAGVFIVTDAEEQALGLPSGAQDVALVLQDKRLSASGEMIYAPSEDDYLSGVLGDVVLVNGTPNSYLEVEKTLYRLRFVNASNARLYNVAFNDGRSFSIIATDGGLIEKPVAAFSFYISPGERVEILVDFSNDAIGSTLKLKSLPFPFGTSHNDPAHPQGMELELTEIRVTKTSTKTATIPSSLSSISKLSEASAVRTRHFTLTMDHSRTYGKHLIDGKVFEMGRIDYQIPFNDIEVWEFENQGESIHGMHVHGTQFQVLERLFGDWQLQTTDQGWKDTVYIGPNETVRVIIRFSAYKGIYLLHCHNLEHEDDGMMVNLEVV